MKCSKSILIPLALFLICSMFISCQKENDETNLSEYDVVFSINIANIENGSQLKSAMEENLPNADKIILTIQYSDGSATKYTSAEMKIKQMNGVYYTQNITLKTGGYNLTEFVLVDQTGNTILAVPLVGSVEAQNVSSPLPIAFTISKDMTTTVEVEVISTTKKTPEDFGLNRFPITEVKTFDFLIGVADSELGTLLTAKITVTNGTYAFVQDIEATPANVVEVKDGYDTYTITIEKPGYESFSYTYSIDSLKAYENNFNNPLIIDLLKIVVVDMDGNVYQTIAIGSQVWMAENLKTTKFNDGTDVPTVVDNTGNIGIGDEWSILNTPAYCWYNDDFEAYGNIYGALYNWYAVNAGSLCPTGWHVPTNGEWMILGDFLGGYYFAGGKLKETGYDYWNEPNAGADNSSGFSALPGGYVSSVFTAINQFGLWWSSSECRSYDAYFFRMRWDESYFESCIDVKGQGMSVRCIKD